MSAVEEAGTQVVPALSFKERLAQRRKELEANTTFEIEVPGYDGLWARYRTLGHEENRLIGLGIEKEIAEMGLDGDPAQATGERLTAAGVLAEACMELLEFKGRDDQRRPIFQSTGYRWTGQAARDLFDIDIPPGVDARTALGFIFPYPRDMLLVLMFNEYMEQASGYLPEMEQQLMGESQAPSGPTT